MTHNAAAIAHVHHASMTAGCDAASWSPEVISLYGDPDTILDKLGKFDLRLDDRRVFVLTVETNDQAEVGFYEKSSPQRLTVKKWRGEATESLAAKLDETILENRGVHCIGEQSKAIVDNLPALREERDVPIPVNATAAFSHAIRAYAGQFMRAKIYLMC